MNDSTPKRKSPRKETLDFIRAFARFYHPEVDIQDKEVDLNKLQAALSTGFC